MYGTIVADPPWQYNSAGSHLRASFDHKPKSNDSPNNSASSHTRYGSMSLAELKALDVAAVAAENAHLYLWTTNAFMVEAHDLMAAWGFKQKTILTWAKVRADGTPSARMGYYFRGATEHILFGVRGKQRLLTGTAMIPNLLLTLRTQRHSAKPVQFFDLAERVSPGPRLEMFAREPRLGWDAWGNEFASDIQIAVAN